MPYKADSLQDRFSRLFSWKQDYVWLATIPDATWHALWRAMAWQENDNADGWQQTRLQLLESVQVLSAQITAIGLEPELVRINPDIERFESPFLNLNAEVQRYVDGYRRDLIEGLERAEDDKHVQVLLDQCENILNKVRKNARRFGISVNLTYHGLRLAQSIARIRALLAILDPEHDPATQPHLFQLIVTFARAENRKYSLRDLFKSNVELLALQVTEHAGRHGEHYIAESRQEWTGMAKAAMGAGLIVGFMALIADAQPRPPAAAVGRHLLRSQLRAGLHHRADPAPDHSHQAAGDDRRAHRRGAAREPRPQETAGRPGRSGGQGDAHPFVAILGNVLLAIPTAGLIAFAWQAAFGAPVVDVAKAQRLMHDIDPIHSLALPHAAIAGVFLFLSGLIAGYYDNKAIYRRIPERISSHPGLKRLLGEHRAWKLGSYIEHNLGALAGNFYFGMFLA